jgi:hypothetical protein
MSQHSLRDAVDAFKKHTIALQGTSPMGARWDIIIAAECIFAGKPGNVCSETVIWEYIKREMEWYDPTLHCDNKCLRTGYCRFKCGPAEWRPKEKIRFSDGATATTSPILEELPDNIVRTKNSTYKVEWYEGTQQPEQKVDENARSPIGGGQTDPN